MRIVVTLFYKGRKEYEQFGEGSFPVNGNLKLTPEQEKINELEKKLKEEELDRDILKKAIGIFCSLFLVYFKMKFTNLRFPRAVDEICVY